MGQGHAKEAEMRTLAAAQEDTHFTLSEVKHLRKHYERVCGGSELTRDQFGELVDELHLPGLSDSREMLDEVFTLFDIDESDSVNFKDLLSALSICARGSLEERILLAFHMFGATSGGVVSRASMLKVLTHLAPLIRSSGEGVPGVLPSDASSSINSAGVADAGVDIDALSQFVDTIFAECDLDADGALNIPEFTRAVRATPQLLAFMGNFVTADTAANRPRRYLVAVDGGESCHRAFQHVLTDLQGREHSLHLVVVVRKLDPRHKPPLMSSAKFEAEFAARHDAMLATMQSFEELAHEAGVARVETEVVRDVAEVGPAIIDVAHRIDADVLAMGFEGQSGRQHNSADVHLGYVASYCIQHAHCSVLIIK
ncbi:neuronal calcium sensor 1 [Thecamonas trahens ATCC 50062]|uniref:Neuronal calcium sensor 1 n=1 Tax=Thecamonas trahens ATCC 50062 TaxID=461836 RepID=A0A0L0DL95_THETB|nr:neuronal calcium sensor 1 [Thecamonas trahens ATCC 50062]KNC52158.1 neuronal calcium sensor 1 [Thecamonas trahens ATCC 50062]|eukprot:XP_013762161.1 neuronal calcium sensor 1 [Thecamonas trahens ATCC 50062]